MQHVVDVCDGFFEGHGIGWGLVSFFAVSRGISCHFDRIGRMLKSLEIML